MYKVVDLFAGAGGLSLGFMQTQKFEIKVAFENNPNMQETYRLNHPKVDVRGDVCGADYKELEKQYGKIDVVIGGPPCQGFSNANRQRNHAISQNNMLVKQYIRAIVELQPKAFVMENVSMLKSDVHRFYLDKKDKNIVAKYNIPTKETEILLLDEPFSALDYQSRLKMTDDVYEIIKREKKTAIMVTHDLGEAIVMSNRVIILSNRPATIKEDVNIKFENKDATPFDKRKESEYNEYFRKLWGELDN